MWPQEGDAVGALERWVFSKRTLLSLPLNLSSYDFNAYNSGTTVKLIGKLCNYESEECYSGPIDGSSLV